ncbi:MAG: adenylate/guanylate cyclase domain-containing protein [Alphaproteobacteria bacterium]|nr:adenylate/guanylate cyclase domain-containing protein [Alphaproteobacteria bacterium]
MAAIVCADVAGYSRLIGVEETNTLARLKTVRTDLIDPSIAEHGGRIVKTTGDGLLIEFGSVVDATRCAIAVQCEMARRDADVPADRRIAFRIGIHMGDIVIDGDDILGDGVNVAARLEALAEPGGVCVSGRVQEDLAGKLDVELRDGGDQALKNIARPVRLWHWSPGATGAARVAGVSPLSIDAPPALPDKPSIAVLPFQNMSGDPEQEYFVDGLVEDIITALSRFKSLFVIARNSSFAYKGTSPDVRRVGRDLGVRYVLEGSVRKAGDRVRITGQLIDAANGAHLWADRIDGALADVFDLQDRVTEQVVAAIAPRVQQAEIERVKRKPPANLDAYDCYLRGLANLRPISKEGTAEALRLFERSVELDPNFSPVYGMAAACYAHRRGFGFADDTEQEKVKVVRLVEIAVRVCQEDAAALGDTAWAIAYILRDLATAKVFIDQALALNPNLASVWACSSWINLWLGDAQVAVEHVGRALRLDPRATSLAIGMKSAMAHACFFLGRYEEAIAWAEGQLSGSSTAHPPLRVAAASAALAGNDALARLYGERLHAADPAFRVSRLADYLGPYQRPEFLAKYAEGLRRAGLPE